MKITPNRTMSAVAIAPVITDRLAICPGCSGFMRFAHTEPCRKNLPEMPIFECRWCSLLVTAEQVLEVSEQIM